MANPLIGFKKQSLLVGPGGKRRKSIMNRSYRTIWNESLGAWVAASEITTARGKKSSSAVMTGAVALGVGLMLQAGAAFAQNTYLGQGSTSDTQGTVCSPNTGSSPTNVAPATATTGYSCTVAMPNGAYAIVNVGMDPDNPGVPDFGALTTAVSSLGANAVMIGGAVKASGADSIAFGTGAQAFSVSSIAVGKNAVANGTGAVALGQASQAGNGGTAVGNGAVAAGNSATAIGNRSNAYGGSSVAVGDRTVAADGGVAIGTQQAAAVTTAGVRAVAIGAGARAFGADSISMGTYSAAGNGSVALGYAADGTQDNTVAIGKNAYTGVESIQIGYSTVRAQSNHTGAFRRGTTLIGTEAVSQGLYTTVMGNHSQLIINQNVTSGGVFGFGKFAAQGAFSSMLGAYNTIGNNTSQNQYNSVAVSVFGSANNVQESNGVMVNGYGNTIKNSYNGQINLSGVIDGNSSTIADLVKDPKTQLGQVGVIGAGNTVDTANNTLVVGMRSTVNNADKVSAQGFNLAVSDTKNSFIAGADNTVAKTTNVFTAGNSSTINNASNILALGNNQVIGSGSTTAANSILLGDRIKFADTANASDAVAVGNDTKVVSGAVAVGSNAQALGPNSIAIGRNAIATGSVAYGAAAQAGNGGTAIGDGAVATYMGGTTTAGIVAGSALGQNAKADFSGATALGTNAQVNIADGVAVGSGSVAATAAGQAGYVPTGANAAQTAAINATQGTLAAVSVGDAANGKFRQINAVAAGTADSDAVNVAQLKGVESKASAGWNVAANGEATGANVAPGGKVDFSPTNSNLTVTRGGTTGTDIKIGLANNVDLTNAGSLTTGNTVVNNSGTTVTNGTNVSQLTSAGTSVTDGTSTTASTAAGTTVTNGSNVSTLGAGTASVSNGSVSTVINPGSVIVGQGGANPVTVNGAAGDVTGLTNKTLTGAGFATAGRAATEEQLSVVNQTANKGWNVAANGEATGANVAPGGKVDFSATNSNLAVTRNGTDIKVGLANNIDLTNAGSVTTGNTVVNNSGVAVTNGTNVSQLTSAGTSVTDGTSTTASTAAGTTVTNGSNVSTLGAGTASVSNGSVSTVINPGSVIVGQGGANPVTVNGAAGDVTGLTNKTLTGAGFGTAGRAATEEQLSLVNQTAGKGWNVAANGEVTGANVAPGGKVDFSATNSNLAVTRNGTDIKVGLANNIDLTNAGSVTTGNTVVNNSGVAVTNGTNVSQLTSAGTSVTDGTSTTASTAAGTTVTNGSNVSTLGAGTASVSNGSVSTVINPGSVIVGQGGANPVTVNGAAGDVTGLTNKTLTGAGFGTAGRAATEEQLSLVNQTLNKGWNVASSGNPAATNIAPGGTVTFNGDSNVSVSHAANSNGSDVNIKLNPNLNVSSVTTGGTVINNAGVSFTGSTVTLTSTGLNNGGNKITNVAAGTEATDAVNVSQLQAATAGGGTHFYSVNNKDATAANYKNDGATGVNALAAGVGASATSDDAIAVGEAKASAANAVAIGKGATAADANSVALGSGSQTKAAVAIATDNTLIPSTTLNFAGASNVVGVVSVGSGGGTRQIVNVAPGAITATSTDAINGSQLFAVAQGLNDRIDNIQLTPGPQGPEGPKGDPGPAGPEGKPGTGGDGNKWIDGNVATFTPPSPTGKESLAAGSSSVASGDNSTAMGNGSVASGNNSVAMGQGSTASGNGATALGQGAMATGSGSVAIGNNSNDAGRSNVVSVGSAGAERQITNVAPGTQGTDAVNLNQLNQMGTTINNQFGNIQNQINQNRREANAGTAGAMAMAGMPQAYLPGKSMLAAGAATYRGESAMAVGMSRISDNGRWVTKFTGSANTRGQVGVSVGAGYQW
ncbi:hypothetical protein DZC30_01535 [Comamonas testosteroni]|uniref:Uncharacterized protein n=1 Tax=Comamonas testosteroni TaxID=285 RepID=A0A373FSI3_COMTE|nr:hypothetical protein DZC30_01535 [Comamonas testosteroni]